MTKQSLCRYRSKIPAHLSLCQNVLRYSYMALKILACLQANFQCSGDLVSSPHIFGRLWGALRSVLHLLCNERHRLKASYPCVCLPHNLPSHWWMGCHETWYGYQIVRNWINCNWHNFGWTASPSSKMIIYCLEKVQINKLNVYLQFMLNYDVCYTYESCLSIFLIFKFNWQLFGSNILLCYIYISFVVILIYYK
jgi:hypothetical protein